MTGFHLELDIGAMSQKPERWGYRMIEKVLR